MLLLLSKSNYFALLAISLQPGQEAGQRAPCPACSQAACFPDTIMIAHLANSITLVSQIKYCRYCNEV